MHFVPSAVAGNATIISFLTNSISTNVANIPFSASSGGETFRFEGAAPVRTSISAGPIYAERAQTMGRGRLFVALGRSGLTYTTLRGVPLDNVKFTFTHANVDFPGCDSIFNGDCSIYGVPELENETIDFNLSLDVSVAVTSLLHDLRRHQSDRLRRRRAVRQTSLRGTSNAAIVPFGVNRPPPHFFSGTEDNPVFTASRFSEGSSSGLGDVSARVKVNLREATPVSIAVLADGRFPTGSEADLLGAGSVFAARARHRVGAARVLLPHVNVGYQWRSDSLATDAFLLTAGFDQLLAPWATLAADFISEFQVGTSHLAVPSDVTIDAPFKRTIDASSIPEERDDLLDVSFGMKFTLPAGVTFLTNGIFPLNRGGMRPDVLWTVGAEYAF